MAVGICAPSLALVLRGALRSGAQPSDECLLAGACDAHARSIRMSDVPASLRKSISAAHDLLQNFRADGGLTDEVAGSGFVLT